MAGYKKKKATNIKKVARKGKRRGTFSTKGKMGKKKMMKKKM